MDVQPERREARPCDVCGRPLYSEGVPSLPPLLVKFSTLVLDREAARKRLSMEVYFQPAPSLAREFAPEGALLVVPGCEAIICGGCVNGMKIGRPSSKAATVFETFAMALERAHELEEFEAENLALKELKKDEEKAESPRDLSAEEGGG